MDTETDLQQAQQRILEQLQVFDLKLLAAIHHCQVDVPALARREIANRGVTPEGRWVGFPEAARLISLKG